jgi:16S rRNA (uracil1498-N3)-methyltransferase
LALSLNKIYVANFSIEEKIFLITDLKIVHKLLNVLRLTKGALFIVFNDNKQQYIVEIIDHNHGSIKIKIINESNSMSISNTNVILAVAFPKGKRGDWLVEKATELGVNKIIVLRTDRSIMNPGQGRIEKWQKIAIQASEQCGRTDIPKIESGKLEDLNGIIMIAVTKGGINIEESLIKIDVQKKDLTLNFLVGPEGDWSKEEEKKLIHDGAIPVSLGKRILRVETAAIVGMSIISLWINSEN